MAPQVRALDLTVRSLAVLAARCGRPASVGRSGPNELQEPGRIAWRCGLVLVTKVSEHVDSRSQQRTDTAGQLLELPARIGRLAKAEVAERCVGLPVVHADGGRDL